LDTNQPGYQQGGRLSTLVTGAFQNLAYRYDPGGNITHIVDSAATPVETLEYSYDLIDRLVSDTTNGGNTYGYDDDEGNLEQKGASTLVYADPSNHRVTQMGSNTYSYDANGNLTLRAGAVLSYDADNRMVEYIRERVSAVFLYDGDGLRVKGVVNTITTLYVNDYYEISAPGAAGTTVRKYYSAGGQRIAVRENGVLSYLLADHLGSITVSLDGQNLTGTRSYSSWGETRGSAGTLPTGRGFQGQYAEDELGLLFFNARWVDPELGRFVNADTLIPEPGNPADWDRYAFVVNNPIRYSDPSGHKVWDGCSGETGGCGGGSEYADYVYAVWHTDQEREQNNENLQTAVDIGTTVIGVVNEPADWAMTLTACLNGDCSPWMLMGLIPFIPGSKADDIVDIIKELDGVKLPIDDTLDLATMFLGKDYLDMGNGRFLSIDGLRQVRMGIEDILGIHPFSGGPHINFEILAPRPGNPGHFQIIRDIHIYIYEALK